ncbi:MAG: sec-independent protein translocase protein TatC [Rhodobacteraceae bacterium]|uniref:twin-arginine translocase subunit TatC n=1 Tax=Cypionkella sp. TaxID=2811411 RepID=UPI00132739C4|nr:twin-arginine translocase subunit TatC [Cypionkella sp.]KAF0171503.1 MAG: sec-independent protein translocase protein TatC [Paracoccaceae bacterium]MDO8326762.1 twin-arginine translocase subunit TatC [Cypionkella sp.]
MSHTDEMDASAAPLIEHLKELRNRILISIAAFAVCFLLGYLVWDKIFNILSIPMCKALADRGQECQFILVKLQEGFFVAIKIAVWGGFALAFPIVAFQMWRFVAPGLYRNEKAAFLPFLVASPVMFIIGASFAYFVILPFAFAFFLGFQDNFKDAMEAGAGLAAAPKGVVYTGSVEAFLALTMTFVMAFGLCFQLPVLLTLMGKAGIISSQGLKATRKYAIVAIMAVAAVVTPPDVFSQLILFAAVYPLYEISIFMIGRFERDREAQARADGTWVEDEE